MDIEFYTGQHKQDVINALYYLQKHEHNLSDTRKEASNDLCI